MYEVAYFAKDVATGEMIMPNTVNVDVMTELTTEINTKISTLQITGNLVSLHPDANYYSYFYCFYWLIRFFNQKPYTIMLCPPCVIDIGIIVCVHLPFPQG